MRLRKTTLRRQSSASAASRIAKPRRVSWRWQSRRSRGRSKPMFLIATRTTTQSAYARAPLRKAVPVRKMTRIYSSQQVTSIFGWRIEWCWERDRHGKTKKKCITTETLRIQKPLALVCERHACISDLCRGDDLAGWLFSTIEQCDCFTTFLRFLRTARHSSILGANQFYHRCTCMILKRLPLQNLQTLLDAAWEPVPQASQVGIKIFYVRGTPPIFIHRSSSSFLRTFPCHTLPVPFPPCIFMSCIIISSVLSLFDGRACVDDFTVVVTTTFLLCKLWPAEPNWLPVRPP